MKWIFSERTYVEKLFIVSRRPRRPVHELGKMEEKRGFHPVFIGLSVCPCRLEDNSAEDQQQGGIATTRHN